MQIKPLLSSQPYQVAMATFWPSRQEFYCCRSPLFISPQALDTLNLALVEKEHGLRKIQPEIDKKLTTGDNLIKILHT